MLPNDIALTLFFNVSYHDDFEMIFNYAVTSKLYGKDNIYEYNDNIVKIYVPHKTFKFINFTIKKLRT